MKLEEVIEVLPKSDKLFIVTEHSDQVYEGKTEYVKREVIEGYREATVLCVSPDWLEELIVITIQ